MGLFDNIDKARKKVSDNIEKSYQALGESNKKLNKDTSKLPDDFNKQMDKARQQAEQTTEKAETKTSKSKSKQGDIEHKAQSRQTESEDKAKEKTKTSANKTSESTNSNLSNARKEHFDAISKEVSSTKEKIEKTNERISQFPEKFKARFDEVKTSVNEKLRDIGHFWKEDLKDLNRKIDLIDTKLRTAFVWFVENFSVLMGEGIKYALPWTIEHMSELSVLSAQGFAEGLSGIEIDKDKLVADFQEFQKAVSEIQKQLQEGWK